MGADVSIPAAPTFPDRGRGWCWLEPRHPHEAFHAELLGLGLRTPTQLANQCRPYADRGILLQNSLAKSSNHSVPISYPSAAKSRCSFRSLVPGAVATSGDGDEGAQGQSSEGCPAQETARLSLTDREDIGCEGGVRPLRRYPRRPWRTLTAASDLAQDLLRHLYGHGGC